MNNVEFHVTPAEWQDIAHQLQVFRSSTNDWNEAGEEPTDFERTINTIADVLGDEVAADYRKHNPVRVVIVSTAGDQRFFEVP